jgi:two-component system, NarL family, response regulator NreC
MGPRVVLVDEESIFCEALCCLLQSQEGMEVVGHTSNGREAIQLAANLQPDLLITGVTLQELNGIEVARRVKSSLPQIKILALSSVGVPDVVAEMMRAGASGYVLKTCGMKVLQEAIRCVLAGRRYICGEAVGAVADIYFFQVGVPQVEGQRQLTSREREVLQLVAAGLTLKQIALRMGRSVKTVEMHRRHVMEKVGTPSIAGLTKFAIQKGLVSLNS